MDAANIVICVVAAVFCFMFTYMVMNWFNNNRKF